jgi:hypothetical protein
MRHAALALILLTGVGTYAVTARADQWSPPLTTAAYATTATDQAAVTPVRWYGYRYPGWYGHPYAPRYYGYRPYYNGYYPRRYYYYGPDWDYGYYGPSRFYYGGPRVSFGFGY